MKNLYLFAFILMCVAIYMAFNTTEKVPEVVLEIKEKADVVIQATQVRRTEEQKKVINDPPEIKRFRELIETFKNSASGWDCIIAIADIYKSGAFPRFLPNEMMATELYKISAMCPDGNVAGLGQAKFIECRTETINEADKQGAKMPEEYGREMCKLALDKIKNTPYHIFEKPKMTSYVEAPRYELPRIEIPRFEIPRFDAPNFAAQRYAVDPIEENTAVRQYMRDSQNVHDHSVVAVMKKNLENIVKEEPKNAKSTAVAIAEVRQSVMNNKEMKKDQISDALLVLEKLTDSVHTGFGVSEQDALKTVWSKINSEKDDTLKANLIDTLGKQLASGVEHGSVVCSTGKMSRIIGTFEGSSIENIETSKPLWAVKDEIATLAAKIRDDKVQTLCEADQKAYERGALPRIDDELKLELTTKGMDIYCKELGMSDKIIQPILQTYAEAY